MMNQSYGFTGRCGCGLGCSGNDRSPFRRRTTRENMNDRGTCGLGRMGQGCGCGLSGRMPSNRDMTRDTSPMPRFDMEGREPSTPYSGNRRSDTTQDRRDRDESTCGCGSRTSHDTGNRCGCTGRTENENTGRCGCGNRADNENTDRCGCGNRTEHETNNRRVGNDRTDNDSNRRCGCGNRRNNETDDRRGCGDRTTREGNHCGGGDTRSNGRGGNNRNHRCGCGNDQGNSGGNGCGCGNNTDDTCRKLMEKIRAVDFALYEVILYLDAYPHSCDALETYHKLKKQREELHKEYQETCGPITAFGNESTTSWNWIDDPFPWEYKTE